MIADTCIFSEEFCVVFFFNISKFCFIKKNMVRVGAVTEREGIISCKSNLLPESPQDGEHNDQQGW